MLAMDKKTAKTGRPRARDGVTSGNRSGKSIFVRVDPNTKDMLDKYLDQFNKINPKTTASAVVEKALREFLEKHLGDYENKS